MGAFAFVENQSYILDVGGSTMTIKVISRTSKSITVEMSAGFKRLPLSKSKGVESVCLFGEIVTPNQNKVSNEQ